MKQAMKKMILAAMVGSTVLAATPAMAAPTIYTDRAAFDAAAGATLFESFEEDRRTAATQTYTDFNVSETNGSNLVYINSYLGATNGMRSANIENNGTSIFSINFNKTAYALAFDLLSDTNSIFSITGAATSSLVVTGGGSGFFGVVDNAGFTGLSLRSSATFGNYGIDALEYSITAPTMTAAVPEPASWAMMMIGIGAVGYAMRRRQKVMTRVSFA